MDTRRAKVLEVQMLSKSQEMVDTFKTLHLLGAISGLVLLV